MYKNKFKWLLLTLSFVFSQATVAAGSDEGAKWWINTGLGASVIEYDDGHADAAIGASFNYAVTNKQLITVRATSVGIFDGNDEIGALYGFMKKGSRGYVSASAGVSYVKYSHETFLFRTPEAREGNTIGIPLEIQAFLTSSNVGIGVIAFANVNPKQSFAGVMGALQFGKL